MSYRFFVLLIFFLFFFEKNLYPESFFRRKEELNVLACKTEKPNEVNDNSLVKRILDAYQKAKKHHLGQSMWQSFFDQRHKPLHDIFENKNIDSASFILQNPGASDLFYGIDNLYASNLPSQCTPEAMNSCALQNLDLLIRLGEAMGAIPLNNPEAYLLAPKQWDAASVINKLESYLGITLKFPNPYADEVGALTPRGVVSFRAPQALYQAWRIKQILKKIKQPSVLEIGAGLGRTAFFARLLGIDDYTIIDIPMTATSSAYFLGRTLGEDQIMLLGEKCLHPEKKIKILTPDQFLKGKKSYDLIINIDSLTEMDQSIAEAYVKKIAKSAPIFLSINHEANPFTVNQIVQKSSHVKSVDRKPYWMRNGYVEELYKFKSLRK